MAENGTRRWLIWLAGIVASSIIFVWLPGLTNAVVSNDKVRQAEDKELRDMVRNNEKNVAVFNEKIGNMTEQMKKNHAINGELIQLIRDIRDAT